MRTNFVCSISILSSNPKNIYTPSKSQNTFAYTHTICLLKSKYLDRSSVIADNGRHLWSRFHTSQVLKYTFSRNGYLLRKAIRFLILSQVFHAVFGGIVGVFGNIYELTIRSDVLNNREVFKTSAQKQGTSRIIF